MPCKSGSVSTCRARRESKASRSACRESRVCTLCHLHHERTLVAALTHSKTGSKRLETRLQVVPEFGPSAQVSPRPKTGAMLESLTTSNGGADRWYPLARVFIHVPGTRGGPRSAAHDSGDDIPDITIIGAGPTGQFAAFYAGLRGARTQMIDALEEPGGANRDLPGEVHLRRYRIPEGASERFCRALRHPGTTGRATIRLNEQVLELETLPDGLIRLGTTR